MNQLRKVTPILRIVPFNNFLKNLSVSISNSLNLESSGDGLDDIILEELLVLGMDAVCLGCAPIEALHVLVQATDCGLARQIVAFWRARY